MHWMNDETYLEIVQPKEFNFKECLLFLNRSNQEILHSIQGDVLYKLLNIDEQLILCKISERGNNIKVEFPMEQPTANVRERIVQYLMDWFDVKQDLACFYRMANQDKILQPLVEKYSGLRLIGIPDLFEALVWAIIGQQINLPFAYTLKKRLSSNLESM